MEEFLDDEEEYLPDISEDEFLHRGDDDEPGAR